MEIDRASKARELFKSGYNCSQAVVLAFSDLTTIDEKTILQLTSSFGGGMGRMREVCGSVSGMFMVLGLLYGYDKKEDYDGKKEHYRRVQQLAEEFIKINGSIVCRELLGIKKVDNSFIPEKRTDSYYKKRPCAELVYDAALILENYIRENPIKNKIGN